MLREESHHTRIRSAFQQSNQEEDWQLDQRTVEEYAARLADLVPEHASDDQIKSRARQYYRDRVFVLTLLDPNAPHYKEAWQNVFSEIARITRWKLRGEENILLKADDLIPIAQIQIIKPVKTFQFNSLFSTWLVSTVVNSIRHTQRDISSRKHDTQKEILEDVARPENSEQLEETVNKSVLLDLIREVLSKHKDDRLIDIFMLSEAEDRAKSEIGQLLGLHPSRIRLLLAQAKSVLQQDPSLQSWIQASSKGDSLNNTRDDNGGGL